MNANDDSLAVTPVAKCSRATEPEKAEWVRRFLESGLSLRKFSAQNGLGYMSMWRWVNQAREETVAVRSSAEPVFTEIKLLPSEERSDWAAALSFADGRVLRLSKEVPAAMLEQLLRLC
jgi:transposase-like protein